MKIGIIGSGNIGGTLGGHWAKAGHEVMFSSRHPEELESMAKQANAQVGTLKEAANFSDVILLAIPFGKIPDVAKQIGALQNKLLIDATNPYPQRDGEIAQQVIDDASQTATGYVATQFAGMPVVKAFNSIYYKVLAEPKYWTKVVKLAIAQFHALLSSIALCKGGQVHSEIYSWLFAHASSPLSASLLLTIPLS
jgi:8-hydroxy-5-deazaflavin:NADPH oxidoreductase